CEWISDERRAKSDEWPFSLLNYIYFSSLVSRRLSLLLKLLELMVLGVGLAAAGFGHVQMHPRASRSWQPLGRSGTVEIISATMPERSS
ncbi:MAG: hypothetical protein OEW15_11965, partial [Nitrospirota bacterium]|nr:hypothetical protein [Nitrospirota bacterium]